MSTLKTCSSQRKFLGRKLHINDKRARSASFRLHTEFDGREQKPKNYLFRCLSLYCSERRRFLTWPRSAAGGMHTLYWVMPCYSTPTNPTSITAFRLQEQNYLMACWYGETRVREVPAIDSHVGTLITCYSLTYWQSSCIVYTVACLWLRDQ